MPPLSGTQNKMKNWLDPLLNRKHVFLVVLSLVIVTLVFLHVRAVNGPWYFKWSWQRLDAWRAFGVTLLGATPFFAGQILYRRRPGLLPLALLSVSLSMFLLGLLCFATYRQQFDLGRISHIVESPSITSYYTIAARFSEGAEARSLARLLGEYPDLMPSFPFHGLTKPPGPVLFYYALISWLGVKSTTALAGGLLIGLLAAIGTPMVFLTLKRLLDDEEVAFCGASFYALSPCMSVFFPGFDQAYPLFTCGMALCWSQAIERRSLRHAAGFGLVLSVAIFWSYTMLTLGLFLGGYSVLAIVNQRGKNLGFVARCVAVSLGVVILCYGGLWLATGFDPLRTFTTAVEIQSKILLELGRPYPQTIFWDLYDFALGTGWISYPLAGFALLQRLRPMEWTRELQLSLLAVGQIVAVALTGLLQAEVARVWMPMLPLFMIPVGLELRDWKFGRRMAVYGCLWLALNAIYQNMIFIE